MNVDFKLYENYYSEFATKSNEAERIQSEPNDNLRNPFQIDRDRIIHSKSFRRLKHKTQVYLNPEKDHYRTRLTHTLEVTQIARTIARCLRLNEDLVEAIGLGHDLGHTPFGHVGEKILDKLNPKGFKHYKQSINVVQYLEHSSSRIGLNLTKQTLDGIVNHSGSNKANTLEGQIIKYSDRIAYINHDIDDSIRSNIIKHSDLPIEITEELGDRGSKRINFLVNDLVENSFDKNHIEMSDKTYRLMEDLRSFMFKNVYFNDIVRKDDKKVEYVLTNLYSYYLEDISRLPKSHTDIYKNIELQNKTEDDIVTDYIAGMTDSFAKRTFKEIFIPDSWSI